VGKPNVEVTEKLQDVRVLDHCVPYCIVAIYNAGKETQMKTPEYLGRKETEVLKERETE
jgi:hypothetical protein